MLKKWYFTFGKDACERQGYLIKTSVASALTNTKLAPICLYSGITEDVAQFLDERGVRRIEASFPLAQELEETLSGNPRFSTALARGSYLRFMIPNFELEEEFVLYADYDTIFLKHPTMPNGNITFLAAAPEFRQDNFEYFNNGIMVLNLPALRPLYQDIISIIHLRTRCGLFAVHEQGEYNSLFWKRWDRLPTVMNWKPYWGRNDDAVIVHYHGPKPKQAETILSGQEVPDKTAMTMVLNGSEGYSYYNELFRSFGFMPS